MLIEVNAIKSIIARVREHLYITASRSLPYYLLLHNDLYLMNQSADRGSTPHYLNQNKTTRVNHDYFILEDIYGHISRLLIIFKFI